MYKVEYKTHKGNQAWQSHGSYSTEQTALSSAARHSVIISMNKIVGSVPSAHARRSAVQVPRSAADLRLRS
jgi:hypothetical protein